MNWVTIISYELPMQAQMAKSYLNANNIDVFLKDELTIQSDMLLSNAIGGVKVQVLEEDYEDAKNLLIEGGFIKEKINQEQSEFTKEFDKNTKSLPFLNNTSLEIRILAIAGIFILLISIVIVIMIS